MRDPRLLHWALGGLVFLLAGGAACADRPRAACDAADALRTVCGFENPEDLAVAVKRDAVIISQMRRDETGGSLASWNPSEPGATATHLWPQAYTPGVDSGPAAGDPSCPPPSPADFAPHGIYLAPSGLYVVNHGGRESVELFGLSGKGGSLAARWLGCIELPAGTSANDVVVGPQGEVVVSNMSAPGALLTASLQSQIGMNTGDVLLWRAGEGWEHVPNTAARMPNGVEISADGKHLYFAESGAGRVVRVDRDGTNRTEIPLEGRPDNLTWTADGRLLVATHRSSFELVGCLRGASCRSGWDVFEIDPQTGSVDRVLGHDGSRLGAVASAHAVDDKLYLSAVFDDRIGVWTPPAGR
ncbi:MAG: SMP-30/gluconolactonase/LRE family protein [Candidatus Binatia bacterium]|nr:SMP-30/gluconolactonase/LRE family protein [Candidatus Binatia bacterium]